MKSFCRFASFSITMIFFSRLSIAQDIEVDISGCSAMLNVLTAMKNGASKQEVSSMLDSVLQTRPYQAMFKHYNRSWRPNHLPISVFKQMILSLQFDGVYSRGGNERAGQMLPFWIKFYTNLDLFRQNVHQLDNTNFKTLIDGAVAYAQTWLPPEWHIPDFYVPIHPNGGSRAFVIDTIQGYDFFQFPRDSSGHIKWNELISTISHESHHLGIKTIYPAIMTSSDSVAYRFLSLFIGEGTATKFINDYPGGCVPVIDQSRRDTSFYKGEIGKWWQKYTSDEPDLFTRLITTFERAYSGELSPTELQTEISQFWLNGYVSPVYFVGSELFGAVYHGFGKEGAFTAMRDLRKLFLLYDNAIKNNPNILGRCNVIPDSTVQHALAIGTAKQ